MVSVLRIINYVPHTSSQKSLIKDIQGGLAGHFGKDKTSQSHLLLDRYFRPPMRKDVSNLSKGALFVKQQKGKNRTLGFTVLYRFLRVFGKKACKKASDAIYVANLFSREIVHLNQIPKSIVSDRDVKFLSQLWKTLCKKVHTSFKFSTTSHPQTNGQTVTNRTLGNLIRCLRGDKPRQWDLILPQAGFAYNHMKDRTTGKSPFEIVYIKLPRLTVDLVHIPSSVDFSQEADVMAERISELHKDRSIAVAVTFIQ